VSKDARIHSCSVPCLINICSTLGPICVNAYEMLSEAAHFGVDLRYVHGQQAAKWPLEVARAGGHNTFCSSDRPARERRFHSAPNQPGSSSRNLLRQV
jgi:hypothetical protein